MAAHEAGKSLAADVARACCVAPVALRRAIGILDAFRTLYPLLFPTKSLMY